MKPHNNKQLLAKILLALFTVSLFACASQPKPAPEVYADEPVTANNLYNTPPSMDAPASESSGIAAPLEETTFTEPPIEEMNNVMPPIASMATEEAAMEHASSDQMPMMNMTPTNISDIPADHFAVQIVASSNMKNLNAFATAHNLSNELTAQVTVNDKTWNVLLLGTYPTLTAAKAALVDIKDTVNTSPWIRSVGSLQ